jgi:methionyl-tRNA formyltransferase
MKFAYLNLQEHPRGNVILQRLIKNNLIPSLIIEERSSLAEKNRNSVLSAFENTDVVFPSTKELIKNYNIPLFVVDNHNNNECQKLLDKGGLDLIVLGDTRIIKDNIRKIPKIGIVNSHPGYLPDVKGNNPYIWAIIHDLPQGCSIHFIDENVDTGDVILRQKINMESCDSYQQLLQIINDLCADLMVRAVQQIGNGTVFRTSQSALEFENIHHVDREFFVASYEDKKFALQKLKRKS